MPSRSPSAQQRLGAARLVGAGAISILGQFAVDMPGRYFGASDEITEPGALFVGFVVLLIALGVYAYLTRRNWANDVDPRRIERTSIEAGAWRIEVSPKAHAAEDLFLNVMQVTDSRSPSRWAPVGWP